jgi:D-sedoheptulose 7-phosphate isomerase
LPATVSPAAGHIGGRAEVQVPQMSAPSSPEAIAKSLAEAAQVVAALQPILPELSRAAQLIGESLAAGGRLLLFGNGGSAAQAQHLAAELLGRFGDDRAPLAAFALSTDTSALTAIGNDYGFESIFARQLRGLGRAGDVALAISTSGGSPNVLRGLEQARELGMKTIGLAGRTGGKLRERVDLCLCVPSDSTPRIQEAHLVISHLLCQLVELPYLSGRARP